MNSCSNIRTPRSGPGHHSLQPGRAERTAAALDAWHHVYAIAERHDLGEAATTWQVEEVRVLMQDTGSRARSFGWTAVLDGARVVLTQERLAGSLPAAALSTQEGRS